MFATFSSVPDTSSLIWGFSRIYLYIFISLFIYVILSLFIAIIMDTYEIIKEYYMHGFPKQRMHEFYQRAQYDPASGIFMETNSGNSDPRDQDLRHTLFRVFSFDYGQGRGGDQRGNGHLINDDRAPIVT